MAVAHHHSDTTGSTGTSNTTFTLSTSPASGTDLCAVGYSITAADRDSTISATWDGVSMVKKGGWGPLEGSNIFLNVFTLQAPGADGTSKDWVVSWTTNTNWFASISFYSGVIQTGDPLGASFTDIDASTTRTTASVTVTDGATNDLIIGAGYAKHGTQDIGPQSGETERWDIAFGANQLAAYDEAGGASVAMGCTKTGTNVNMAMIAHALEQATASGSLIGRKLIGAGGLIGSGGLIGQGGGLVG